MSRMPLKIQKKRPKTTGRAPKSALFSGRTSSQRQVAGQSSKVYRAMTLSFFRMLGTPVSQRIRTPKVEGKKRGKYSCTTPKRPKSERFGKCRYRQSKKDKHRASEQVYYRSARCTSTQGNDYIGRAGNAAPHPGQWGAVARSPRNSLAPTQAASQARLTPEAPQSFLPCLLAAS